MFSDLLNETKGFKYQITVQVLLKKKYKPNGEIECAPVYFNSVTKLVINHRFKLQKSFQEILYMIDAWINNGSGWIIESVESQDINISTYWPLLERTYIDLSIELKSPRKGLINIKKIKIKDAFYGVMLGILIRQKSIQKELKKLIKDLLVISVMMTLSFL